jgi:hypothetical protein
MSEAQDTATCPHCNARLQPMQMPEEGGWNAITVLVCFDNECPYYRKGWDWMWEQYQVKASYRYRLNPASGKASPLAVWSDSALRDRIIKDGQEGQ